VHSVKSQPAGLICGTHQYYRRQWLSKTDWSNSRRWA